MADSDLSPNGLLRTPGKFANIVVSGIPLAGVFISAIAVAILAPIPIPSHEQVAEYRIKRAQRHVEALQGVLDQDQRDKRRDELREEYYGPQRIPSHLRVGANPLDPVVKPFALVWLLVFMATSFNIVTRLVKSDVTWDKWFSFSC
ncbi:MAG: hypothetical protein OXG24_10035 [Gammaproteobacteria bacterium]|nr:hypothetical protein [Gammaproteobacteria bacterium]